MEKEGLDKIQKKGGKQYRGSSQNKGGYEPSANYAYLGNTKYSKKTNPKITILEILVYKIQPEIIKSKIFPRSNFITKP